LTWSKKTKY